MEQIKIVTLNDVVNMQKNKLWHKILPILLFVSFLVASLSSAIMVNNALSLSMPNNGNGELLYYLLIYGLADYITFRLFLWLYSMIIQHSLFAMCVPYIVFRDQFQTAYFIKNIIVGIVSLLMMSAPYTLKYLPVLDFGLSLLIIPIITMINNKKFIPEIVAHNVFRAYAVPYFIYMLLDIVALVMGVA